MEEGPAEPPIPRTEATARLAALGEATAAEAGLRCETERSPNSESTYLHVQRGDTWYGIRLSCHEAAYDCCADYEQIHLGDPPTETRLQRCEEQVVRSVQSGGSVVANPAEVRIAIDKIASVMADGRVYQDDDGLRWRWSSDEPGWRLISRHWGEDEPAPPTHRPWPSVSARIRCQVRHSCNVNAKWAAESAGQSPS